MEKEIQITEEIANHELNKDLDLSIGKVLQKDPPTEDPTCPDDTDFGYWIRSGGKCVFVPFT